MLGLLLFLVGAGLVWLALVLVIGAIDEALRARALRRAPAPAPSRRSPQPIDLGFLDKYLGGTGGVWWQ